MARFFTASQLTYTGDLSAENFSLTGTFASDFNLIYASGAVELEFNQGGGDPPPPVPEPNFLLMEIAIAGILLAWKSKVLNRAVDGVGKKRSGNRT